jgi:ribonuclease P protein component
MAPQFSYNRQEKLKSRKLAEQLFAKGKTINQFPVKLFYLVTETDFPVKAGVGATKRNFKKAVDRNRVKRLLREAYRLNKQPLHDFLTSQGKQVCLFFLLTDKTIPSFDLLMQKMPLLLNKLIRVLDEDVA